MIQEGLGIIWKRILALKYALVLTIAFNVIAATSGIACSYFLWTGAFDLSKKVIRLSGQQKNLKEVQLLGLNLLSSPRTEKLTREQAFQEMQSWERLRLSIQAAGLDSARTYPDDYFTNSAKAKIWLENLKLEVGTVMTKQEQEILSLAHRESRLSSAVMWIAAATLILGIAFPLIILSLILKALRLAQRTLTDAAKDIVQDWSKALNRYGEDPFKNAHFWIEALLILTEQFGSQSRHPAAMLSAELSHLVREELHKSKNTAA